MNPSDAISNFSNKAADLTDKVSSKAQAHAKDAKHLVDEAGDTLASGLDSAREQAGPTFDRVSQRAQALANQGMDAATQAAQQLRDGVSDFTDGAIQYTKKNPMKAVLIAAVSGALIVGLVKALSSSRE